MKLVLFDSGLIDEILNEESDISITKIGIAKYRFRIEKSKTIEFDLWTTKIGKIKFDFENEKHPEWIKLEKIKNELQSFKAKKCLFHLEHCDRGSYSINFSRNNESFYGSVFTNGYIKTQLIQSND